MDWVPRASKREVRALASEPVGRDGCSCNRRGERLHA